MNPDLIAVVEGVLLFLNLQCKHLTRTSLKQQKPGLAVTIDTTHNESAQTVCSVQVLASGLGAYFLDGTAFIKQLCLLCPSLYQPSSTLSTSALPASMGSSAPVLEILCRCTGEPGKVTRYTLEGVRGGGAGGEREPLVRETVVTRPSDLHPAALLARMPAVIFEEELKLAGEKIARHIHLIQLVNPELTLGLRARGVDHKHTIEVTFEPTCSKALCRGPINLAVSIHHYIKLRSESPQLSKLRLIKGDTQTLPGSLSLQDGRKVTLRLFTTVAIAPRLRLKQDKKIPINRLCDRLHIFIYGPCSLPLVQSGSQPGFPLSLLADWECYGLSLAPTANRHTIHTDLGVAVSSFMCDTTNSHSHTSQHLSRQHTLLVFLFLTSPSTCENSRLSDSMQWKHQTELVHKLRVDFQELVMTYSKKFHQATHSALNKIACNYGSHSKTRSIMGTALPLVADAVASIVQNSTDEAFQSSCLEVLEVADVESLHRCVEKKLWRMAKKKLGVSHPTDTNFKNPDEPTTPELALAVQGDQAGLAQSNMTTGTTTHVEHVLVDRSNSSQQNTLPLPVTHTSQEDDSQVNVSQHSQSLFSARVHSKRALQKKPDQDTRQICRGESDLGDDDTCFESLCDLPSEHDGETVYDSQPSQPLLSAVMKSSTSAQYTTLVSSDGDDQMSISSFESLENCSESGSLTEGMECDSCGEDLSGYDELEFYEDDQTISTDTDIDKLQEHNDSSILRTSSNSSVTNKQRCSADESPALLPVDHTSVDHEQQQVINAVDPSAMSDDDWDCLLTCSPNVPMLTDHPKLDCESSELDHSQYDEPATTMNTGINTQTTSAYYSDDDFEQLADHDHDQGPPKSGSIESVAFGRSSTECLSRTIPTSIQPNTLSECVIDDDDFEWD